MSSQMIQRRTTKWGGCRKIKNVDNHTIDSKETLNKEQSANSPKAEEAEIMIGILDFF